MNDEVRDVLRRAKEVLLTKGWVQESYEIAGYGYCLSGAIGRAQGYEDLWDGWAPCREDHRLHDQAMHALAEVLPPEFIDTECEMDTVAAVIKYNDAHDRTKEEVISLVDKALTVAPATVETKSKQLVAV